MTRSFPGTRPRGTSPSNELRADIRVARTKIRNAEKDRRLDLKNRVERVELGLSREAE